MMAKKPLQEYLKQDETTKCSTKPCASTKNPIDAASPPHQTATTPPKASTAATNTQSSSLTTKKGPITRLIVKYDVGYPNSIFLRGKGANLSWEKGIPLKNVKPDEWIWETDQQFESCEFKVLINDRSYEIGENHRLTCGESTLHRPKF